MTLKLEDFEPVGTVTLMSIAGMPSANGVDWTDQVHLGDKLFTASKLQKLIDQCNAKDAEIYQLNNINYELRSVREIINNSGVSDIGYEAFVKLGNDNILVSQQLTALQAQNAELRADAEKWRRLRSEKHKLDAEIDAAIAKSKEGE